MSLRYVPTHRAPSVSIRQGILRAPRSFEGFLGMGVRVFHKPKLKFEIWRCCIIPVTGHLTNGLALHAQNVHSYRLCAMPSLHFLFLARIDIQTTHNPACFLFNFSNNTNDRPLMAATFNFPSEPAYAPPRVEKGLRSARKYRCSRPRQLRTLLGCATKRYLYQKQSRTFAEKASRLFTSPTQCLSE